MVVLLDSEIDMCVNYWRRVGFASSGRVAVKTPVVCTKLHNHGFVHHQEAFFFWTRLVRETQTLEYKMICRMIQLDMVVKFD